MTQESKVINTFSGKYSFLSNFYPVEIYYKGFVFPSVEHAYQSQKSDDPEFWRKIASLPAKQAGLAKRLGKNVKRVIDWDNKRVEIMKELILKKFSSGYLKYKLHETKGYKLIEGNWWHDNFWGDCSCEKCKNIVGNNILGILLMSIRDNTSPVVTLRSLETNIKIL